MMSNASHIHARLNVYGPKAVLPRARPMPKSIELTDVIARRIWEDDKSPCYCAAAVNKAIEASNRATRHISAKEACLIHALLKGPCQITHLTIGSPAS